MSTPIPDGGWALVDVQDASFVYATQVEGHIKTTEPQCVFLDQTTGYLWMKQLVTAGSKSGDLCITRLTPVAGGGWSEADHMFLYSFGHGGSFSVDYDSSTDTSKIWIECMADANGDGTALCHLTYNPAISYTGSNGSPLYPLGQDTRAAPIAIELECVARYDTGILVARYSVEYDTPPRPKYYQAWTIADAETIQPPAFPFPNPFLNGYGFLEPPYQGGADALFAGWTFLGQYLYFSTGNSLVDVPAGNVYLYSIDLNTGSEVYSHKNGDPDAYPREPEGVMIDSTGDTVKVVFGLTNTKTTGAKDKALDLQYVE